MYNQNNHSIQAFFSHHNNFAHKTKREKGVAKLDVGAKLG